MRTEVAVLEGTGDESYEAIGPARMNRLNLVQEILNLIYRGIQPIQVLILANSPTQGE